MRHVSWPRACHALGSATLLVTLLSAPAVAQERRWVVVGQVGYASIGHADSEQGKAPIFSGGVAVLPARWLVVEADVHGARLRNVFGRERHDFTQVTLTGSLLFRAPVGTTAHLLAGGGLGVQRAHIVFDVPPIGLVDDTQTIRLVHGRFGAEWDVSERILIRADGVLWLGSGLDWVLGGRAGLGYRF